MPRHGVLSIRSDAMAQLKAARTALVLASDGPRRKPRRHPPIHEALDVCAAYRCDGRTADNWKNVQAHDLSVPINTAEPLRDSGSEPALDHLGESDLATTGISYDTPEPIGASLGNPSIGIFAASKGLHPRLAVGGDPHIVKTLCPGKRLGASVGGFTPLPGVGEPLNHSRRPTFGCDASVPAGDPMNQLCHKPRRYRRGETAIGRQGA